MDWVSHLGVYQLDFNGGRPATVTILSSTLTPALCCSPPPLTSPPHAPSAHQLFPSPADGQHTFLFDGRRTLHRRAFPSTPYNTTELQEAWPEFNLTRVERDDLVEVRGKGEWGIMHMVGSLDACHVCWMHLRHHPVKVMTW